MGRKEGIYYAYYGLWTTTEIYIFVFYILLKYSI